MTGSRCCNSIVQKPRSLDPLGTLGESVSPKIKHPNMGLNGIELDSPHFQLLKPHLPHSCSWFFSMILIHRSCHCHVNLIIVSSYSSPILIILQVCIWTGAGHWRIPPAAGSCRLRLLQLLSWAVRVCVVDRCGMCQAKLAPESLWEVSQVPQVTTSATKLQSWKASAKRLAKTSAVSLVSVTQAAHFTKLGKARMSKQAHACTCKKHRREL